MLKNKKKGYIMEHRMEGIFPIFELDDLNDGTVVNTAMHGVKEDTDSAVVYSMQGALYYYLHEYRNAIDEFTKAIDVCVLRSDAHDQLIDLYRQRAEAYRKLEEYVYVVADYTRALELDSTRGHFYSSRGVAYKMLEQYDRALADYTRATQVSPDLAEPYYCRGILHSVVLNHPEKAIEDYTEALKREPTLIRAYMN